jgi:hypothetical protein
VELSTLYLRQLAEEQPALAGLLLKNESSPDFLPLYTAVEVEEETHQEAVEVAEAVEEVEAVEEAEEHRLLRSPCPHLKQLSPKQLISELWERPQEYSKEIERRQKTSSTNYNTIIASIEESLDSIPP